MASDLYLLRTRAKALHNSSALVDNVISEMMLSDVSALAHKKSCEFLDRIRGNPRISGQLVAALPYLCVQLACEMTTCPFHEKLAIVKSTLVEREYRKGYLTVSELLGIKLGKGSRGLGNWIQRLGVHFGSPETVSRASELLDLYLQRYVETLSAAERQYANLQLALYPAAAFIVVMRALKRRISVASVASFVQVSPKVLNPVVKHVEKLCHDFLSDKATAATALKALPTPTKTEIIATSAEVKRPTRSTPPSKGLSLGSPKKAARLLPVSVAQATPQTPSGGIARVRKVLQETTFNTPTMGQSRKRSLSSDLLGMQREDEKVQKVNKLPVRRSRVLYAVTTLNPMIVNPMVKPSQSKQFKLYLNLKREWLKDIKETLEVSS